MKAKAIDGFKSIILAMMLCLSASTGSVAEETQLDPVVRDVVGMLEAGVDEKVIIQWLDVTGRRPLNVEGSGIIAMTEAGASESLLISLLERVDAESAIRGSRSDPPSRADKPSDSVATVAELPADGRAVEAKIRLRATEVFVEEDEPDSPRRAPWGVFLYLDGELISWSRPSLAGESVEVRRFISTGRRELRVVLQRYEDLRDGWSFQSLAVPTLVTFDARPGVPIEIDVEMKRIWGLWRDRKSGGPLSFRVRQGTEVKTESRGVAGNPDHWLPVCEDVEANFRGASRIPRRFRGEMNRCVRWKELWTGVGQQTSRVEILDRLAADDFQPPV